MSQFELIFKGELVEGFSLNSVRDNIAKLFKASPAQVKQMFSGNELVLRNRLDSATAKKYQAVLRKNGAISTIREMGQPFTNSNSETTDALAQTAAGFPVAGEKVDEILAGVDWQVAPPGTRMEEKREIIPLPEPDLSHLSLAPPGSDIAEKSNDLPPSAPDTSHIELIKLTDF